MTLDYFYGAQADQFAFYRIPKALFTDERFKSISAEAKILYGILLDRMSLSRKNGWLDEQGRVFIIFTLEEVMEAIGCADQKATKLLNELDSKAGLIERKRQGLGKPNLIFVKNFVDNSAGSIPPAPESRIKTRENHDSADVNFTTPESRKSRGSNTDSNYTDLSETEAYPFPSGQAGGHGQAPVDKMGRDMDEREQYRAILEENLEYDILLENNPYDQDTIAEIMELLLDTICSKRQYIRIAGDDKPREVVKSQFLKLNCTHMLNNFKRLGVQADPMNGKQRLELLHGIFHMDEQQSFLFDWDWLAPTGLSVKDFIAPSSFSFRNGKNFTMGRKIGQVSFLQILAPELNDRMLADFLDKLSEQITKLENNDIIGMVREIGMTPEQLAALLSGKPTDLSATDEINGDEETEGYEHEN